MMNNLRVRCLGFCRSLSKIPFIYALYSKSLLLQKLNGKPVILGESAHLSQARSLIRQQQIRVLHQEVVLLLVRGGIKKWWDNPQALTFFHFNDEGVLRTMLREGVLKRLGDREAFVCLTRRLNLLSSLASTEDRRLLEEVQHSRSGEPYPVTLADDAVIASSAAMMNGLLALHGAEMHAGAQSLFHALHLQAKAIWEDGRRAIDPAAPSEHVRQISRMLWHFDLLPEAAEYLAHFPSEQPLYAYIAEVLRARAENAAWAARRQSSAGGKACVLGMTIWGEEYTRFMLDYHFPSLLAAGNVPALAGRGMRIVISVVTDEAGQAQMKAHPAYARMEEFAEFHFTPVSVAPSRRGPLAPVFYSCYGMLDHHHIFLARALDADVFMMPVDCVFSSCALQTFGAFLEEGYDCCTIANIEAYKEEVQPVLDAKKDAHRLTLEGRCILDLSVRHKTNTFRSLVFDPGHTPNPYPRELFWRVPGGYVCHSLFVHPFAVSRRALARAFHPNHENVDWAFLPRLLQGSGNIKVVENGAAVANMHCSARNLREDESGPYRFRADMPMMQYLLSVHMHDYPLHRQCFNTPQFFPCEDPTQPVSATYGLDVAFIRGCFAALAA